MRIVIPMTAGFLLGIIAGLEWKRLQHTTEELYTIQTIQYEVQKCDQQYQNIERRITAMENVVKGGQPRWK